VRFDVSTGGTNFGSFDLELFDQEKPQTVQNFLTYVYNGVYSNLVLNRFEPNFVIQAGRVTVTNPASTAVFDSYVPGRNYGPIPNEYSIGPELSNDYGTIAMARIGGQTNSAAAEWFFESWRQCVPRQRGWWLHGFWTGDSHVDRTHGHELVERFEHRLEWLRCLFESVRDF